MSQETIEARVGAVELEQVKQRAQLESIKGEVGRANAGIDKLLEREEARPQPLSWTGLVAVAGGLVVIAGVGWWLIGTAPAVQDLRDRMTKLDDKEFGAVTRLKERVGELEEWRPRVSRY